MPGKILLVEDDSEQSRPLIELLRFRGYDVVIAENGVDGVAFALRQKPDVVIVDLLLAMRGAEVDGYELIKTIRTTLEVERVGILAWTSHFVKETDHIRALRSGADDFITKDVSFGVFEARIEALLRRVAGAKKT